MDKKILVAEEVAELLRVDKQRVYELTRQGKIPFIQIGERQYHYCETALLHWLESGGNQQSNGGENEN